MRGKNPAVLDVELLNPYNGIDASRQRAAPDPQRPGPAPADAASGSTRSTTSAASRTSTSTRGGACGPSCSSGRWSTARRSSSAGPTGSTCSTRSASATTSATSSSQSKTGSCNGNFLGIGADDCQTAIVVEQSAPFALLITNGEFVSFHGPDPTMVEVTATHTGAVRFVNCAFWGPCNQIARDRRPGHGGLQRLHLRAMGPRQRGPSRPPRRLGHGARPRLRVPAKPRPRSRWARTSAAPSSPATSSPARHGSTTRARAASRSPTTPTAPRGDTAWSGTRSRAEGDSRSEAKRCGSIRTDPTARRPDATPEGASVESDRRAKLQGMGVAESLVAAAVAPVPPAANPWRLYNTSQRLRAIVHGLSGLRRLPSKSSG